jgi:hypothetical protein
MRLIVFFYKNCDNHNLSKNIIENYKLLIKYKEESN